MLWCACFCATLALLLPFSESQNWNHDENGVDKYITRPDIVSPRWNVQWYGDKEKVSPGYWFTAPYEKVGVRKPGGAWVGPHIYDGEGGLIWSGSYKWDNINIMDFRLSKVRGEDRLTMMFPVEGDGIILDNHYNEVDRVSVGITGKTLNMHEFQFVENGASLLLLKRNITRATKEMSKVIGYDGNCQVIFSGFEDVDAATWETKFTWKSWDHIPLDDSTLTSAPVDKRCGHSWWDYLHSNAIDKFDDGHYLFSGRHADTVYKIDKDDGHIHWRLGGPKSDFQMGNVNFSRQHHTRFREQNETHTIITLLDNAKGQDNQSPTADWSRALMIALRTDVKPMTAELVRVYDHPERSYSWRRGNYQILDNDNAFICWSEQSLQSEHSPDGQILFEARMEPHWVGTYRTFKAEFVGMPLDPPDVYSQAFAGSDPRNSTMTLVHVSWNGATEVKDWNLYKTTKDGKTKVRVASRARSGFETALNYDGFANYVVLEAVDKNGKPLGQSKVFETRHGLNMSTPAVAEEIQWLQDVAGTSPGKAAGDSWKGDTKSALMNPIATFCGGVIASFIIVFLFARMRRRSFWNKFDHRRGAYSPLAERDAAEYDETKLDDMRRRDGRKGDSSERFPAGADDDDDLNYGETGGLQTRTPYARQVSTNV